MKILQNVGHGNLLCLVSGGGFSNFFLKKGGNPMKSSFLLLTLLTSSVLAQDFNVDFECAVVDTMSNVSPAMPGPIIPTEYSVKIIFVDFADRDTNIRSKGGLKYPYQFIDPQGNNDPQYPVVIPSTSYTYSDYWHIFFNTNSDNWYENGVQNISKTNLSALTYTNTPEISNFTPEETLQGEEPFPYNHHFPWMMDGSFKQIIERESNGKAIIHGSFIDDTGEHTLPQTGSPQWIQLPQTKDYYHTTYSSGGAMYPIKNWLEQNKGINFNLPNTKYVIYYGGDRKGKYTNSSGNITLSGLNGATNFINGNFIIMGEKYFLKYRQESVTVNGQLTTRQYVAGVEFSGNWDDAYLRLDENRILVHEFGHAIGLWHTSNCGIFTAMIVRENRNDWNLYYPITNGSAFTAVEKMQLGWVVPNDFFSPNVGGQFLDKTIQEIKTTAEAIKINISSNFYYILENRNGIYKSPEEAPQGLLIYQINNNVKDLIEADGGNNTVTFGFSPLLADWDNILEQPVYEVDDSAIQNYPNGDYGSPTDYFSDGTTFYGNGVWVDNIRYTDGNGNPTTTATVDLFKYDATTFPYQKFIGTNAILEIGNPEDISTLIGSPTTYNGTAGILITAQKTFMRNNVFINMPLVFASGSELVIEDGSTITFGQNGRIVVNGEVNCSNVTFTSDDPQEKWRGFVVGTTGKIVLNNSIINNALIGVYANACTEVGAVDLGSCTLTDNVFGIAARNNATNSVLVMESEFANNSYGIYCDLSGQVYVDENSEIHENNIGIYVTGRGFVTVKNSTIYDNFYYGINLKNEGNGFFGSVEEPGLNRFYSNGTWDIYNELTTNNSQIFAQSNFWIPNNGQVSTCNQNGNNCYDVDLSVISSCHPVKIYPNADCTPNGNIANSQEVSDLLSAFESEIDEDFALAETRFMNFITNYPTSNYWSTALSGVVRNKKSQNENLEIIPFLEDLILGLSGERYYVARELLLLQFVVAEDFASASEITVELFNIYTNTQNEILALLEGEYLFQQMQGLPKIKLSKNLRESYPESVENLFNGLLSENLESKQFSEKVLPKDFSLSQNHPNPFNPMTTISYTLPQNSKITLTVYNTLGQKVVTLANKTQEKGTYSTVWNGKDENGNLVSSGVYFYKLEAGNFVQTKKMVLLK